VASLPKPNPEHPDNPFNEWYGGRSEAKLKLLTPTELEALPAGTEVWSIMGEKAFTGDPATLDTDTRYGYTAWGRWTVNTKGPFWSDDPPPSDAEVVGL
jgi:hypothetical protein